MIVSDRNIFAVDVVVWLLSHVQLFSYPRLYPARLLYPWDFPGKNTGVDCHFLLQGNLPNPGIEPASLAMAGRFFTAVPPGKPPELLLTGPYM